MKKINITYWIFTGLAGALMLLSAIPNIMSNADSIKLISDHMHFPAYFIPMVGVAKLLGVIAILIPGFPRIKEWAYAGLFYDLAIATYSFIALGDPIVQALPMFVFMGLLLGSYFMYHKKLKAASANA